jgi:hypothetical protein
MILKNISATISLLFFFLFITPACSVELKDKNETETPPLHGFAADDNLVWNEAHTLDKPEIIKAHKLTIRKNALITTGEFPLVIQVDELITEGGTIQNFPPNTKALWGTNGRTGGGVQIEAKYATGALNVILRGENGGHGKNGAITVPGKHPGCAGTNGGNGGNAGNLQVTIETNSNFTMNWDNFSGEMGERGYRGSVQNGTLADTVFPPCDRNAADGVNGKAGNKGTVCLKLAGNEERICE